MAMTAWRTVKTSAAWALGRDLHKKFSLIGLALGWALWHHPAFGIISSN
jgi:hypothetical protein